MEKKEYIERGAILRKSETMFDGQKYCTAVNTGFIYTAPAADVVEVVHGEWIPNMIMIRNPYARNYNFSICNYSPIEPGKYCGNCGAKMDGGKK